MTPVLLSPDLAVAAVVGQDFFHPGLPGLAVEATSLEVDRSGLRWRASLRTGLLTHRSATLRLYSSPSNNVTVLELIPEVRRLIRTRSFVRNGVPAIAGLADRLKRMADPCAGLDSPAPVLPATSGN